MTSSSVTAEAEARRLLQLQAIGYVEWDAAADTSQVGVVLFDRERTESGYNLYSNGRAEVYLCDLSGTRVHHWTLSGTVVDSFAELLDDGSLVVGIDHALARYSWSGTEQWRLDLAVHHDIAVKADGTFLVWYSEQEEYHDRVVEFDGIAHVSADGEVLDRWYTFDHLDELKGHHGPSALDFAPGEHGKRWKKPPSYYHANSLEILGETPLGSRDTRFRAGNLLISLPKFDAVMILDQEDHSVVWSYGEGQLQFQHMPTQLANGNLLIFDNGLNRGYTRVLELDPVSLQVSWQYQGDPRESFFSQFRGSNQRLSNGNTLICESERGHAFEVTRQGEVVWDFWNPLFEEGKRRRIYRFIRYPAALVESFLE